MSIMSSIIKMITKIFLNSFSLYFYLILLIDCGLEFLFHGFYQFIVVGIGVEAEAATSDRVDSFGGFVVLVKRVLLPEDQHSEDVQMFIEGKVFAPTPRQGADNLYVGGCFCEGQSGEGHRAESNILAVFKEPFMVHFSVLIFVQ